MIGGTTIIAALITAFCMWRYRWGARDELGLPARKHPNHLLSEK
jgi:hypothetical protein